MLGSLPPPTFAHCAIRLAPAKLTTRKAGAEPALSGCRTLSASIPIPRRVEILAVLRRESDDLTLPCVAGSKEWPNRALSDAVALSMPLTVVSK